MSDRAPLKSTAGAIAQALGGVAGWLWPGPRRHRADAGRDEVLRERERDGGRGADDAVDWRQTIIAVATRVASAVQSDDCRWSRCGRRRGCPRVAVRLDALPRALRSPVGDGMVSALNQLAGTLAERALAGCGLSPYVRKVAQPARGARVGGFALDNVSAVPSTACANSVACSG
jgi:hypothetical protein